MHATSTTQRARLRLPGAAALDTTGHDTPKVMPPPNPLRRIFTGLAAALTIGLFSLPGVSRADVYIDGTRNWDGITSEYTTNGGGSGDLGPNPAVGGTLGIGTGSAAWGVPEWLGWGILNQTAGTVTTGSGMWIGFNWAATSSSAYHMSGTAVFSDAANPSVIGKNLSGPYPGQTYIWSLADSASATVGSLTLGLPNSYLLLSGTASFTATSLSFYDSSDYISFATGSTATLTVASENLAGYQALVTAGNIRVDGVVQTDFSAFQVSGHTLSLSTGAPTPPQLVITSVSPASPTVGIGFDVTVETQDSGNLPQNVTADTEVTLTLKIGTGTGTLGGTTTGTILNGASSVTISGVTYSKPESGVVLEANASGLPTGESAPFTVLIGAPAKLAFGSQPNSTGVGDPIPPYPLNGARAYPAVTVLIQDAAGNLVTSDTSSVTIGGTTFTGDSTLTVSAVGGVATFSNLKPTTEGSAITLTASDGLLTEATSDPFTVGADVIGTWYLQGTVNRSSDRVVTGAADFFVGVGLDGWYPGWIGSGTLNQTAGTITTHNGVSIGYNFGAPHGSSAYHMSGTAVYTDIGGNQSWVGRWRNTPGTTYTWSLTDTASATVGSLAIGDASHGVTDSYLLLSGSAAFSATSLTFYDSSDYISFATGSAATLTISGLLQADYEALVTAGNIRVDGVVQTDFSAFQVTASTLSLAVTGTETSATALAVNTNTNPSTYGDLLSFHVTVSGESGTPAGYVFLKDGGPSGTVLGGTTLTNGACTITTTTLALGTHDNIVAVYRGDSTYANSTSAPLAPEQVVNLPSSTVTVTGATSFIYDDNPQGPNTAETTGSSGPVTYSYAGTGSTTYGPTDIQPTDVGTYTCTATLAADANYAGAVSAPFAFAIVANNVATVTQSHDFAASNAGSLYNGNGTAVELVSSGFFSTNMLPFNASLGTLQSFTVKWETISGTLSGTGGADTGGSASGSFGGTFTITGSAHASAGGGNGGGAGPGAPLEVIFPAAPIVSEQTFTVADAGVTYDPAILAAVTGASPFAVAFDSPVTVSYTNVVDLLASVTGKVTLTYTYEPASHPTYAGWATENGVTGGINGDSNNDGVQNGIAYFMKDAGLITHPGIIGNTVTWPNGGNIPHTEYGADKQFVIETSTDLVNWTPVGIDDLATNTSGPGGELSYTLPEGVEGGKIFARLLVTPN